MTKTRPAGLYYHGLRNCGLYVSLSTFYKYVNALGLKRKFPKPIKKTEGLKALQPNQYLHVDTTIWELDNAIKAYFVFVTDNFSKAILGWHLSLSNSAANVRAALHQAIKTIHQCHPSQLCSVLVADGGGENHSITIDELLMQTMQPKITKVIAQKDIAFSNSPIEAINRTVKRYLRHYKPQSKTALHEILELVEHDYNHARPHISLNGLIPMEAYTEPEKNLYFTREKQQAKALRLLKNRKTKCGPCE